MSKERKTRAKGGRPTSLTPAVQRTIVRHLKTGAYVETAAAAAGVSKDTLYEWLKRGAKEPGSPYRAFSDAVEKAMADAELDAVRTIDEAGKTQWQARAWRLERTKPLKYSIRVQALIREREEQLLELLRAELDEVTFERVLGIIARRTDGSSGARAS